MTNSNFLGLNLADILKGLIMAILTPSLVIVQQSLSAGTLTFNWQAIGMAAVAGGVAYLLKNLLSNSEGTPMTKEKQ
jgi:hypothetical protein